MKIVVTGSTGLVGKALMGRLKKEGYEVATLGRPTWDGEKDIAPVSVLKGTDVVVHLAGENVAAKRWTTSRKNHLVDSRVKSAHHLKLGLEHAGVTPKLFLSASGIGVFGDRGDEVLTERSSAGHDFLAKLCIDWEAAALDVGAGRTVMLRFGAVLSPDGGFLEKVVPMFKRFGASRLGSGKQWFSWIHVDDTLELILHAIKTDALNGSVNAVAPHALTNAQMTEEMRLQLKTFSAPAAPAFALKILYGQLTEALLGSQRAVPEKLEHSGFKWKYPTFKEGLAASGIS